MAAQFLFLTFLALMSLCQGQNEDQFASRPNPKYKEEWYKEALKVVETNHSNLSIDDLNNFQDLTRAMDAAMSERVAEILDMETSDRSDLKEAYEEAFKTGQIDELEVKFFSIFSRFLRLLQNFLDFFES